MIKSEVLILSREDLRRDFRKVNIEGIEIYSFNIDKSKFRKESMIIFIDDNLQTKILKSRWGDQGIVNKPNQINILINKIRKWWKNL